MTPYVYVGAGVVGCGTACQVLHSVSWGRGRGRKVNLVLILDAMTVLEAPFWNSNELRPGIAGETSHLL